MTWGWPDNFKTVPLLVRVDGKTCHFKDGSTAEVDAIILCTGWARAHGLRRPAPPLHCAALRCAQSPWRLPDRRDAHSHITLVHCHMHQPCPPHSSSTPSLTRGARQVQAPLPLHALVTPAGDAQPPLLRPAPRGRDVAH